MPGDVNVFGVTNIAKSCYGPKDDYLFSKTGWLEYNSGVYRKDFECYADMHCNGKLMRPIWDELRDGRLEHTSVCFFFRRYCMDSHIYVVNMNNGTVMESYDWIHNERSFEYSNIMKVHPFFIDEGADELLIQLSSGLRKIDLPLSELSKVGDSWSDVFQIKLDDFMVKQFKNPSALEFKYDVTNGLMSDTAMLSIDLKCLYTGQLFKKEPQSQYKSCFSFKPLIERSLIKTQSLANKVKDVPSSEILNCEQGYNFKDPSSPDTILIQVESLIGFGTSFIPVFGPIISAGINIGLDAVWSMDQKKEKIQGELTSIAKSTGKIIFNKLDEAGFWSKCIDSLEKYFSD